MGSHPWRGRLSLAGAARLGKGTSMANGPRDELRSLIERKQVLAIVGAGVSIGATGGEPKLHDWPLASWPGLLFHGVEFCEANATMPLPAGWGDTVRGQIGWKNLDGLLLAAEAISRVLDAPNGGDFRRWLRAALESLPIVHTEVIEAIAALGIPIATTNYDGLIEAVAGLPAVTWRQDNEVERVLQGRKRAVLHLHGHWEDSASVVLGIRSYGAILDSPHAQAMQRASRAFKTLLFIGVGEGLNDPNFGALRDWARTAFAGSETLHYRLALDGEVAALQAQHPPAERILVLGFGPDHGKLADFLRGLAPVPPLKPASPPPSPPGASLPAKPNCFGRDKEIKDLVRTLREKVPPPTPVIGGPGMGKTTVTVAALHDPGVAQRYGARRFFVRCDPARTRDEVVALIANAVGVPLGPDREPRLLAELASGPAVLVLDNLETPWEHDATPTEDLLGRLTVIPGLALVASIRGQDWPAGTWREPIGVEPLTLAAARAAFLAVAGKKKFGADPLLDDLLAAVDRVPLAVVLLAHYARPEPDLSAVRQQWLARRADLLHRLGGDDRLLSFAVSVETSLTGRRMTDDARRLLRLLGVLPDGIERSDLDAVLPGAGVRAAHTLRAVGLAYDEAARLRVLAPIRAYIGDHHPPTPAELAPIIVHYTGLAETEGMKVGGEGGGAAALRLSAEMANIETMILVGLSLPDPRPAIDAAIGLSQFLRYSGLGTPRVLERAREVALAASDDSAVARCSLWLGILAFARSDHETARTRYEEALPLYRRVGAVLGQTNCIKSLGDIALGRSDHETARTRYEEALPLYRRVGDVQGQANCIRSLGDIARERSNYETAQTRYEEALGLYSRIQEPYSIGGTYHRLALIAPDADARMRHARAAREAWRRIGREDLIERWLGEFGDLDY
jgi:tetratricopeptide (TPR) repeat protein